MCKLNNILKVFIIKTNTPSQSPQSKGFAKRVPLPHMKAKTLLKLIKVDISIQWYLCMVFVEKVLIRFLTLTFLKISTLLQQPYLATVTVINTTMKSRIKRVFVRNRRLKEFIHVSIVVSSTLCLRDWCVTTTFITITSHFCHNNHIWGNNITI